MAASFASWILAASAAAGIAASTVAAPPAPAAPPAASSASPLDPATGFALGTESAETAREQAYRQLLALDDRAQEEIDRWIQEADAAGASSDQATLRKKVADRIAAVGRAYEEFLARNPEHVKARVAFGSFLNDTGQEGSAAEQWERARELDPRNPAIYNNLAGVYGHRGPITNAFFCFEKAIELEPKEAIYYQNFGTAVFLFRKDVMEYYGIQDEQKVFDKALGLYRKALELKPDDFIIAADLAQTYYGIKPPRHDDALTAWQRAYLLAGDDLERQGVRVHRARIQVQAGRFDEARFELNQVTNANYGEIKERILKTLATKAAGGSADAPEPAATGTRAKAE